MESGQAFYKFIHVQVRLHRARKDGIEATVVTEREERRVIIYLFLAGDERKRAAAPAAPGGCPASAQATSS